MSYFKSTKIRGVAGTDALVGSFGELLVGQKKDDVNVKFIYNRYDEDFDLQPSITTGSATATISDGDLVLTSGVGETVLVQSKESVRYRNGHTGYIDFTFGIDGETGLAQSGGFDQQDGFFIEYNNDTSQWAVGRKRGGTEFKITQDSFNGNAPLSLIDPTKKSIFRIVFGYLGIANAAFLVKRDKWYVLHELLTENRIADTSVRNPSFPISSYAEEGAIARSASWAGGVVDGASYEVGARYFSTFKSGTLTGTDVLTIGNFRNKATYEGINNKVKARLLRHKFVVDPPASGTGQVEFIIRKNATLTGTPSYTSVDDASVVEFDETATYASGGKLIFPDYVSYSASTGNFASFGGGTEVVDDNLGLYLLPNETVTVTAQNVSGSTAVTVRVVFNWIELF